MERLAACAWLAGGNIPFPANGCMWENGARLMLIVSLLVWDELRHVEDVCCGEFLLHLVKLKCTNCVEVSARQLLLKHLRFVEVHKVLRDAAEVVFEDSVVFGVGEMRVIGKLRKHLLLRWELGSGVLHVFSKVFRHC